MALFFMPKAWKWYSYIDSSATELVAAVRAINAFFSLSSVLTYLVAALQTLALSEAENVGAGVLAALQSP